MLSYERTVELLKLAKTGDMDAKEELVAQNMPLIKSIVKRFRNKSIEYDDLIQLGSLGLIKAINNFDASFNVKFSTYAVPMISGEIKRFIRDDGCMKVSRSVKALSCKISKFSNDFRINNNREPTVDEIAEAMEVEPQEVVFALDSSKYPVSLYEKYDDESSQCVVDRLAAPGTQEDMINKIVLKDLINSLDEREKKIIVLRYYRDKTQSEIAKLLGVSQVQISRIENKVLKLMRENMTQ